MTNNAKVRQCAGALNEIKVTLAAMDSKYNHILSLFCPKREIEVVRPTVMVTSMDRFMLVLRGWTCQNFQEGNRHRGSIGQNSSFSIKRQQKIKKVLLASFHLEGEAVQWY